MKKYFWKNSAKRILGKQDSYTGLDSYLPSQDFSFMDAFAKVWQLEFVHSILLHHRKSMVSSMAFWMLSGFGRYMFSRPKYGVTTS